MNKLKYYVAPSKHIQHITFGYKENLVDALWIRLIQDYDMCEQGRMEKAGLTRDDQKMSGQNRVMNCQNGWVYHMLDAIMEMAPKFRMPAATGGVILSVLVDDIQGATKIFNKAVQNFPNDWPILYRAAYHFIYEEEDTDRASELLVRAGKNGAPRWVFSLAAKLYSKQGKLILAKSVLEQVLSEIDIDAEYAVTLRKRLNKVNAELAAQKK